MRDVDQLLAALEGPPPPAAAPEWPASERRWSWRVVLGGGGALLAAAAVVLLTLQLSSISSGRSGTAGLQTRGIEVGPGVTLDLRMVVERGGIAVRPSGPLRVGERVLFRAAADPPGSAALWVEGPAGRERIAEIELGETFRDVGDPSGLTAYRFEVPGRYVFRLSTEGVGVCNGCPSLALEVR